MVHDELLGASTEGWMIDPVDPVRCRRISPAEEWQDLLVPVFREGQVLVETPPIHAVREHVHNELQHLHAGIKRFVYPHRYPALLDQRLYDLKSELVLKARGWRQTPEGLGVGPYGAARVGFRAAHRSEDRRAA